MMQALAKKHGFRLDVPVKDMKPKHLDLVLYGDPDQIKITLHDVGRARRTAGTRRSRA